MANLLGIDILGIDYHGIVEKNIIYRLNRKQLSSSAPLSSSSEATTYSYLVVSEKIDQSLLSSSSIIDIFVIRNFKDINNNLKKKLKEKRGIGLEVTLADLRKSDGVQIGKWFNHTRELYEFCKSSNCQFILSSGASSILEMVSGRSFDSILRICNMNPDHYWQELGEWIDSKSHIRCL